MSTVPQRVVVVGGGAAGSTAAYTLRRAGCDVVLLEAGDRVGGRTQTEEHDGFAIDTGAVYLLNLYERTAALLAEAAGPDALRSWSPPAGLWDGERLHRVRYDWLASFLRLPLLSRSDRLRLLVQGARAILGPAPSPYDTDSLAVHDRGETMEAWSRRTLGDGVHEYLVRPWVEPAFGVGTERLAVPFLRGVLKRAHRARFAVPATGMGDICRALTRGVDVRTGTRATRIVRTDGGVRVETQGDVFDASAVVVATEGPVAAELLAEAVPDVAPAIRDAPYSTMVHATIGYRRDPWPDCPVDMALPVGPGEHPVVGIILHGRKSPDAVPDGAQAVDVYFDERFSLTATDDEARARALEATLTMLGPTDEEPVFVDVRRWEHALALAPPGHYARMQRARRAMPATIRLAGDYLAHLGVETAVVTGERAAQDILERVRPAAAARALPAGVAGQDPVNRGRRFSLNDRTPSA